MNDATQILHILQIFTNFSLVNDWVNCILPSDSKYATCKETVRDFTNYTTEHFGHFGHVFHLLFLKEKNKPVVN